MNQRIYISLLALIAVLFSGFFVLTVVPALAVDWDIVSAFAAGFVNPFASGYSVDVILCWCILAVWIIYERSNQGIKHGFHEHGKHCPDFDILPLWQSPFANC